MTPTSPSIAARRAHVMLGMGCRSAPDPVAVPRQIDFAARAAELSHTAGLQPGGDDVGNRLPVPSISA
jgi:hypothetical protein